MTTTAAPLLTLKQLARLLQVPESTLYSWRTQGIGPPSLKIGRGIRYRQADVARWLEHQADDKRGAVA
jgi:excisionase family DNA binding protein